MTKKNGFSKLYVAITLIVCLALCISMADIMSTFITFGSFSFANGNIRISEYNIYALSLSQTTSKVQAVEESNNFRKQNAAGFVWQKDGIYHVLASGYLSETDANKVKDKLKESEIECSIVKLKFEYIAIQGDFNQQEKNAIYNCLNAFKTCYARLYDISVALDTSVKTHIDTKIAIGNLQADITKIKSEFENIVANNITNSLLNLKLKIQNLIVMLDELSKIDYDLSSETKYCYFESLRLQQEYYDENVIN